RNLWTGAGPSSGRSCPTWRGCSDADTHRAPAGDISGRGSLPCGKKYDKSSYFEKPGGLIYWGQQRRLGSDEAKKIVILEKDTQLGMAAHLAGRGNRTVAGGRNPVADCLCHPETGAGRIH